VARLFAASEALNELMGKPPTQAQLLAHERDMAILQQRLEPSAFAAARAEGRAMSLEAAIAYALRVAAPS
jgi:hypothetical protein